MLVAAPSPLLHLQPEVHREVGLGATKGSPVRTELCVVGRARTGIVPATAGALLSTVCTFFSPLPAVGERTRARSESRAVSSHTTHAQPLERRHAHWIPASSEAFIARLDSEVSEKARGCRGLASNVASHSEPEVQRTKRAVPVSIRGAMVVSSGEMLNLPSKYSQDAALEDLTSARNFARTRWKHSRRSSIGHLSLGRLIPLRCIGDSGNDDPSHKCPGPGSYQA